MNMNKLGDTVAKRERYAMRCQAKLKDQARQHMKEKERLHIRITVL